MFTFCPLSDARCTCVIVVPFWIRFLQCLRRYYFTRNNVHLAGAVKYMLTFLTTIIASTQGFLAPSDEWGAYRTAWLLLLIAATTYNFLWDVVLDWGLLRPKQRFLRPKLMYPAWSYYVAMFLNLVLRLLWVFTILPSDQNPIFGRNPAFVAPLLGFCEIFRRCLWGVFRVEFQHLCDETQLHKDHLAPLFIDGVEIHDRDGDKVNKNAVLARTRVLFELALWAILLLTSGLLIFFL